MADDVSPDWPGAWSPLPADDWAPTRDTLHLWTQIVGKVRMACAPAGEPLVARHPVRGRARAHHLPGARADGRVCDDLRLRRPPAGSSSGADGAHPVGRPASPGRSPTSTPRPWAAWPSWVSSPASWPGRSRWRTPRPSPPTRTTPTMTPPPPATAGRPGGAHRVLSRFRAGFTGKASPVHFFWGAFDLAVTRFSGRPRAAPSRRCARTAPTG